MPGGPITGRDRALVGEPMGEPERRPEYPPIADERVAREAAEGGSARALRLCRELGVPVPARERRE